MNLSFPANLWIQERRLLSSDWVGKFISIATFPYLFLLPLYMYKQFYHATYIIRACLRCERVQQVDFHFRSRVHDDVNLAYWPILRQGFPLPSEYTRCSAIGTNAVVEVTSRNLSSSSPDSRKSVKRSDLPGNYISRFSRPSKSAIEKHRSDDRSIVLRRYVSDNGSAQYYVTRCLLLFRTRTHIRARSHIYNTGHFF